MRCSIDRIFLVLTVILVCAVVTGCPQPVREQGLPDLNKDLELELRLTVADFSIVGSNSTVVTESMEILSENFIIPDILTLEFAGKDITAPEISSGNAVGMRLSNGRSMTVYLLDPPRRPSFGEIIPLALAHYSIPSVNLDLVLFLVCFQYDTEGSDLGIGVRSVNLEGIETSAPFAVALKHDELADKFFYDGFINGAESQVVAGRDDWDQGFLLLTRLDEDTVLSTYLPWY